MKQFCDFKCQQAHIYRRYVEAWLAGQASGSGTWANVSRHVRRYLHEQCAQCVLCGWAQRHPVTGRIPLHIDHIDGNWHNNRPDNLRLLCPNCHALTPNYGALNRGKGRPFHMIKMASG